MYKIYTRISCSISGCKSKSILVMKLTTVILIAVIMQVNAASYAQRITYARKNVSLAKVFSEIRKQTGYSVFLLADLKGTDRIDVSFKNSTLDEVMNRCLQGTSCQYVIEEKTILIKKENRPVSQQAARQDTTVLAGRIIGTDGRALPGASITVVSTDKASFAGKADQEGRFKIFASRGSMLTVSYVGYETKNIKITRTGLGDIVLKPKQEDLKEVRIVIGYGSTTERLNTGNVAVVTSEDIKKQPVSNVLQALQNMVPGLRVSQVNGFSSAPFNVKLRGQNNLPASGNIGINNVSEPLFIIDGVPIISGTNAAQQNLGINQNGIQGPTGGQSPLFGLNPNDIESVSILKDADATAIYGARGANGVILITTKKGQAGKTTVDATIYSGLSLQAKKLDLMNTPQYLEMRARAFQNDGTTPNNGNGYDLTLWDQNRYTDWQKELLGTAHTTDAQLSLSGGSSSTTFRLNGGFNTRTPPFKGNYKEQRGSGTLSLHNTAFNNKLTTTVMVNFSSTISNLPSVDPTALIFLAPNAPSFLDQNGRLDFDGWRAAGGLPYEAVYMQRIYHAGTKNLVSNLNLKYQLLPELSLNASMGYSLAKQDQLQKAPSNTFDPASTFQRETVFGANNNSTWLIEPNADWQKSFGKHHLQVLLGATFQNTAADGSNITARGFTSDALLGNLGAATDFFVSTNDVETRFQSLYSRISYNYDNKYIINLNGRRDGSSRFASGRKFGNFGAIGAAWIFSDETFFRDKLRFLSMGKIRASYGLVGSDGLGDYQYLSSYKTGDNTYQDMPTLQLSRLANDQFRWTTNKKAEIGLELGFLNGRINTSISVYRNRSGNQLVGYPLPSITGFSSIVANLPALVQNSGIELNLQTQNLHLQNFSWSSSLNISRNNNKLLEFPGLESSAYAGGYAIGRSISSIGMRQYAGVDPTTGLYTFADINGDGTVDIYGSKDYIYKDDSPAFFGGFNNNLQYKKIQLSMLFAFSRQKGVYRSSNTLPGALSSGKGNQLVLEKQYSGKPALENLTAVSYRNDLFNFYSSDAVWVDASYIRLQNLSLSYSLDGGGIKKAGLQSLRFFAQAQDLLTITGYKGSDPASPGRLSLPPRKIVTAGLQFTL